MMKMRAGCEDMARIICFSLAAVEDEGIDNLKGPLFEPLFQERRIGGKCLDFYRLPYAAIRTVDFGVRANIEQCKKLMTTIRRNGDTQHIAFRKAEYRDDIYGYKFVEL